MIHEGDYRKYEAPPKVRSCGACTWYFMDDAGAPRCAPRPEGPDWKTCQIRKGVKA